MTRLSAGNNGLLKTPFKSGKTGLPVHKYVVAYHGRTIKSISSAQTASVLGWLLKCQTAAANMTGIAKTRSASPPP